MAKGEQSNQPTAANMAKLVRSANHQSVEEISEQLLTQEMSSSINYISYTANSLGFSRSLSYGTVRRQQLLKDVWTSASLHTTP